MPCSAVVRDCVVVVYGIVNGKVGNLDTRVRIGECARMSKRRFQQDCEHCQKPGKPHEDFLVAVGPDGAVAWWARKDCPIHGVHDVPEEPVAEAAE